MNQETLYKEIEILKQNDILTPDFRLTNMELNDHKEITRTIGVGRNHRKKNNYYINWDKQGKGYRVLVGKYEESIQVDDTTGHLKVVSVNKLKRDPFYDLFQYQESEETK